MEINTLPKYDMTDNPTGCCPRFDPDNWDGQDLHFQDKLFVRTRTRSLAHIPLNMGSVFKRTFKAIEKAGAQSDNDFIVMSRDPSAWSARAMPIRRAPRGYSRSIMILPRACPSSEYRIAAGTSLSR